MIADIKPYPEYNESGHPWLGQVPAHWAIRRIKTVFRELDCRSTDGGGTLLSLTRGRGLIPHVDRTNKMHSAKTLVGYKRYKPGQIVMNRMQAWSGMFGVGATDGLVSPDYAVFAIIGDDEPKFLLERLRAPDLVGQFALESKGIGSGFNRLYTDKFGAIAIALPPSSEQAVIVRFLDWANGRLERAVGAKRKVIALLRAQKRAIIERAVTRGVDASITLKPSGSPWLGDIPHHWKVSRLKFVAKKIVDCLHATPRYTSSGVHPAIRTADIRPGVVNLAEARKISASDYALWTERLIPREGDILYSREGERFGIAACVPPEAQLCISQRMMVFRIADEHCAEFVMWLLNSRPVYGQALQDVNGAAAPHVNISTIRNYTLALPAFDEQTKIARHINTATRPVDVAILRLEREIELLREYRTRLVADVATGKLDVRKAVLHLPIEAPPETQDFENGLDGDPEVTDELAEV